MSSLGLRKLGEFNERYGVWLLLVAGLILIPGLHLWKVGEGSERHGLIEIITINQLGRYLCFAIVALGVDLIWGYTGILSLCQAMFFCIGGYAIGMHMALHGPLEGDVLDPYTHEVIKEVPRGLWIVTSEVKGFRLPWFWEPFQTLPAALLLVLFVPGIFAFIFGYFTFRSRVKGVYFSIITQATTFAVAMIFRRNSMRLGGTNGLNFYEDSGTNTYTTLAGYNIRSDNFKLGMYCLTVLVLFGVYLGCRKLVHSRLGRILVAIRDNESRLRFSGYQPLYFKLGVFTLAAMIAGIGGMLYTPQNGIITPYVMDPDRSILMVIWVAVGGRATLAGAVVGALVVNYATSIFTGGEIIKWYHSTSLYGWVIETSAYKWLYPPTDDPITWLHYLLQKILAIPELLLGPSGWPFLLGALFIAVVMYFPNGLVGGWMRLVKPPEGALPKAETDQAAPKTA